MQFKKNLLKVKRQVFTLFIAEYEVCSFKTHYIRILQKKKKKIVITCGTSLNYLSIICLG